MKHLVKRTELYEMLWSKEHSIRSIAKDWEMTQGNLKEICKYLDIPIPTNTEKNKIYDNYYVCHKSLSNNSGKPEELEVIVKREGLKTMIDYEGKNERDNQLDFLSAMERYNLLKKTDEVRKSIEREVPLSNNLKNKKK